MRPDSKFKIVIVCLCFIIFLQAIIIIRLWPKKKIKPVIIPRGKIAIVLDDWGYNLNNLHFIEDIDYPLTISVLPNLVYSQTVAQKVKEKGKELILHLPLEPQGGKEYIGLEKDTITTKMTEVQINRIIRRALDSLSGIRGVSNHMGSKATKHAITMEVIFRELKKRDLDFLDSLVSPNSVCSDIAKNVGIKFSQRDIFLDNQDDPDYIKIQIEELKQRSLQQGYAVGVGHDRKTTLLVLKKMMPQIEKEGYKFVFLSELLN
jgi:polysaccharide deacetylase 2 family uncharacterized protein YibQ